MNSRLPNKDLFHEAVELLRIAQIKITDNSDFAWVSFDTPAELRNHINSLIGRLEQYEFKAIEDAYILFLPTATLQEHAISNGWSDEYMKLASKFDQIYEQAKRNG